MGTGGMRLGAGRPGYRAKAEQLHRVDVRIWVRQGYLNAACAFSWAWHGGGEQSGSISVHVHAPDVLTLRYTITQNDVARDVVERVTLARTACPYGGKRPWFNCTRCARQVAVLYLRRGYFACRHCQRVAYSSQSDGVLDRMLRKQAKIEARLDDDWRRPKGMRRQTYERLLDTLEDCAARRDAAFIVAAQRLLGRAGLDRI
jgi:hypothetical protein